MDSLAVALPVFLISAVVVVIAGIMLARYGDELAVKTGWGALWVGTILVSTATSLPEVVTNVTAVIIGSPSLALGNILGANMVNIFVIAIVAIIFGTRNVFGGQPRNSQNLVILAIVMGLLLLAIGLWGDFNLGPTSVGGVVIIVAFIAGMRWVYKSGEPQDDDEMGKGNATKAWIGFGLAALAIIIAAQFLARSADSIATITGLGAGFMGVLAVSLVTTLPEGSVTITAAYRKSYGIVIGNVYGSCAFNASVLFYSDFFHGGPLLSEMGPEHFVAAGGSITLMTLGYFVIRSFQDKLISWMRYSVFAIPLIYIGAIFWVYLLSSNTAGTG
ncbi:MAG: hypothetical protein WD533_03335 [Dehalococcoidia bacterium]